MPMSLSGTPADARQATAAPPATPASFIDGRQPRGEDDRRQTDLIALLAPTLGKPQSTHQWFKSTERCLARPALQAAITAQVDWRPRLAALPAAMHAVPFAIKDNTALADLTTRHGSRAFHSAADPRDAELVQRFSRLGLIPLVKTALPEFGLTATTEFSSVCTGSQAPDSGQMPDAASQNLQFRQNVDNPWRTGWSAGGSSGGSAALVAAQAVPAAHANDGGGSIRIPAACCGLVGLKPSCATTLPVPPMARTLPINIISEGFLTRTVRDTALIHEGLVRDLPLDRMVEALLHEDLSDTLHRCSVARRMSIGVYIDRPDGSEADAQVCAAVGAVAEALAEAGHAVEWIGNPNQVAMGDDFLLYWSMLAASIRLAGTAAGQRWMGADKPLDLRNFRAADLEPMTRALGRHFLARCWKLPGSLRRLRAMGLQYRSQFGRYDVLLSPVLGERVPQHGWLSPALDLAVLEQRLRDYACFTPPDNVAGTAALALPVELDSAGLPLGVQLAADHGGENRLLQLGLELERAGRLLSALPLQN